MLARAGAAQHGVVARWQLLRRGFTEKQVKGLIARGFLQPLYRGVYAVGHRRISREGRWHAAVLACGTGAVLSHRSAAEALGLRWRSGIAIEVTRPRTFRPQSGLRCHRAVLRADEVGEVDGIPVTSPFRTALDVAALGDPSEVEHALHEIQVRGMTDAVSLDALLGRHSGHRGAALLRRVRASKAPIGVPRNVFERAFVAFLDEYGLPRPAMNATLALRGRFYEIDALWRLERLAAELDGREVHGTGDSFESDRQRDRILLAEGWRTTRITWLQLRDQRPALAADLRLCLARPGTARGTAEAAGRR
jgi:hypothetical protein